MLWHIYKPIVNIVIINIASINGMVDEYVVLL